MKNSGIIAVDFPGRGRGYKATRFIRAGEVLLREQCISMVHVDNDESEIIKLDSTAVDKNFIGSNARLAEETRRICSLDESTRKRVIDIYPRGDQMSSVPPSVKAFCIPAQSKQASPL